MKYGLPLAIANPSAWVDIVLEAERLGFESVWLPEHLVLPMSMEGSPHDGASHPPIPPRTPVFDAMSYLAFLAAKTTTIRLGTYVYNLALRHPFVSARAAATLQHVSGGRFEFGIGVGWLGAEWQATGLDFATRGARADEAIEVCKRLWTEETVEHHGTFYDFDAVAFEPKPSPPPRLHIGGDGPAALRRAATVGDGWIPMNHSLEQIGAPIKKLAQLRADAGIEGKVEVTTSGGGIAKAADEERFAEVGIDRLIVSPWQRTSGAIEGMRRFAEDVIHG